MIPLVSIACWLLIAQLVRNDIQIDALYRDVAYWQKMNETIDERTERLIAAFEGDTKTRTEALEVIAAGLPVEAALRRTQTWRERQAQEAETRRQREEAVKNAPRGGDLRRNLHDEERSG